MAPDDSDWMAAATRLAEKARPLSSPNPAVAALIVRDGRVLASGWTQPSGRPHAEAHALSRIGDDTLKGATLYVTLEPCAHDSNRGPSCSDLLVAAAPDRVVVGVLDPDPRTSGEGLAKLRRAGIEVVLLDDDTARQSLSGFLSVQTRQRPKVTLKLAMSLDGCIALADGTSQWITGTEARAHVHAQRARYDAILVGGGTWRADRPRLDVRLSGIEDRSPSRVLLTRGVAPDDVRVINRPEQIGDLEGVQYIYVEGGAETAASFLKADLVDELHIYRAPIVIGDGLKAVGNLDLSSLDDTHDRWTQSDSLKLGSDTFAAYHRRRN